jgi:hypothetical protein
LRRRRAVGPPLDCGGRCRPCSRALVVVYGRSEKSRFLGDHPPSGPAVEGALGGTTKDSTDRPRQHFPGIDPVDRFGDVHIRRFLGVQRDPQSG